MGYWSDEQAQLLAQAVGEGVSVRAAALQLGLALSRAYAIAHELGLPLQKKRATAAGVAEKIVELFRAGTTPMDIARALDVDPSTVYRVGIAHGCWQRSPLPRRAMATRRRCAYLMLRVSAMGRADAARAVGIHVRTALDIDKGLVKVDQGRIVFVPAGPDARLYNRLMKSLEYVDGRQAVAVQQLPLHMVEKTISDRFLHVEDRETIADLHRQGYSMRAIARKMGRNVSTISRELRRGSDEFGLYRPHYAHRKSVANRLRPKQRKVDANPQLAQAISQRLAKCYSPEQIAGELRLEYPDDDTMHVCHETIYQMLYCQARGSLRKEIAQALRQGRTQRVTRGQRKPRKRFVDDMVMIADRPAEVEDRAIPGHWEGDLILGAGNQTAIGTLVERTTRYTMLLHLPNGHGAEAVRDALIAKITQLPQHLRQSLTWDQGSEMAGHKAFTIATDCPVYFCNPGSPWQRGTNENTNGLLRQYFPKGTDLSKYGPEELDAVAHELNDRPRKTLGFRKPSQCLAKLIQDNCCNDR